MQTEPRGNVPPLFQPLARAFSKASTVEEVTDSLITNGLPALDACVAVVAILNDDATDFYCPRIAGYSNDVAATWRRFSADARVPIAEAVRNGRLVLLESLEKRKAYYDPDLQLPPPVGHALAAVPMRHGRLIGGLGFTFRDDRSFDLEEQNNLLTVSQMCAAALGAVRRDGIGCEVLVVDGQTEVLRLIDYVLRFHGFVVRKTEDGRKAVQIYEQHSNTIDVVLLDAHLERQDGPETLAAIKRIRADVRCVCMTGGIAPEIDRSLRELGADSFLPKPFYSLDELMKTLRAVASN